MSLNQCKEYYLAEEFKRWRVKGANLQAASIEVTNEFVKRYLPMVRRICRKYRYNPHCVDFEDLVQEGLLGLIHAAGKYKPGGRPFHDYASQWIRYSIRQFLLRSGQPIRRSWRHPNSVDVEPYDEADLADTLNPAEEALSRLESEELLSTLNGDEWEIIHGTYWEGKLERELAQQLGCSYPEIAEIHRRALIKLKGEMQKGLD